MRRNGLVNQVEFLGLAHAFATVLPSNVENILCQTRLKQVQILKWRFTVVRKVLRNNHWSHNLIGPYHFLGISPRNSTSFTRPFLARRCAWARHKTKVLTAQCRTSSILAFSLHFHNSENAWKQGQPNFVLLAEFCALCLELLPHVRTKRI